MRLRLSIRPLLIGVVLFFCPSAFPQDAMQLFRKMQAALGGADKIANPSRDSFKTKADVVKFVQEAVADGAQVIQQQGDAGLDHTTKFFDRNPRQARMAIAASVLPPDLRSCRE